MYDTSSSHVLCALVEKLTGKKMLDYMKEAIKRLQDAYNKGYIDKESLTNATSN